MDGLMRSLDSYGPPEEPSICRPASIGELSFSATLPSEPRLY